jgi:hypothetical protein
MIGRKAAISLSLLCALCFCALSTAGASAAGTTAYACEAEPEGKGSFSDAHCNTPVGGNGKFKHSLITGVTEFELTNKEVKSNTAESEPILLSGLLGGVQSEVLCKTAKGGGVLENKEEKGTMRAVGEMSMELTECTMPKPVNGEGKERCKVREPIVYVGQFSTVEKGSEMGVEFVPMGGSGGGKPFVILEFEEGPGTKCPVAGKSTPVEGSWEGTMGGTPEGIGATMHFSAAMSKLTWGGVKYTIQGILTWKMKGGGSAIAFTTN